MNRYAVDGRLLASYELPNTQVDRNADTLALLDDTLVLRLGGQLYSLSIDAPAGAEIAPLEVAADTLSFASYDGRLAASKGAEVFLVNAKGEKQTLATLAKNPEGVQIGPDGGVYAILDGRFFRVAADGTNKLEPIGSLPGERPQFVDGYWYGSGWHSTLRRFGKDLQPAPGVVLGGIVHLLAWQPATKRFQPIRRIGSLPGCAAIGLDREGRVWCGSGQWNWSDGPASPQRLGVAALDKVFGLTPLGDKSLCGFGCMWGKPTVLFGTLDKELRLMRIESQTGLPKAAVAAAVTEIDGRPALVVLEGGGQAFAVEIHGDGKHWRERRRFNACGTDGEAAKDTFGGSIRLAVDSSRLWVADTARSRVVCLDLATGKRLGSFGTADSPGDDLSHFASPTTIAARGDRAVVYDSSNQRLMKLRLATPSG